ncbi:hypothetical protein AB5I41_28590 [Sphingomonas sp. MMS24-JH45]
MASQGSGELWLMEDVRVEVGGPAPFATLYPLINMPGADPDAARPSAARLLDLVGLHVARRCGARRKGSGLNCRETPVTDATGGCWRTTFGDWKCTMNGRSGATVSPTRPRRG